MGVGPVAADFLPFFAWGTDEVAGVDAVVDILDFFAFGEGIGEVLDPCRLRGRCMAAGGWSYMDLARYLY